MKVFFNGYPNHWLSPYTILDKIFFWREINYDEPKIIKLYNFLNPFCNGLQTVRKVINPQIRYVKLDKFDTWNFDNTLAYIILPALKQLKETKHGAPGSMPAFSQTSDQSGQKTFKFYAEYDDKAWEKGHEQWDVILDKMIFAFDHVLDESWKYEFSSGVSDLVFNPKVEEKIQEGLNLFGKYYLHLWD